MINSRREEIAAALVALSLVSIGAYSWYRSGGTDDDNARPAKWALSAPIPVDEQLHRGTLPNGVRYFIRANASPKNRAELRLAVNAGSVLEGNDQRGIAHAVEHMVFRGTRHFPGREVMNYLQRTGMRAGSDINARTTRDETVYRFTVPTDRGGVLDTAIAILADMSYGATFDAGETRAEAGVVLEEWRSRSDADDRLYEQRNTVLLSGSRYATRSPIGDTAVLLRFDAEDLRRFYAAWYRPELISIVAVGDFDADSVEQWVKQHFSTMPKSAESRPRPQYSVPYDRTLRAATLTDVEATESEVSLWLPRPAARRERVSDYRADLVARLWRDILAARLEDVADDPGSPLLYTDTEKDRLARPIDAEHVSATVADGRVVQGARVLVEELGRLVKHGPTDRELTRSADALLRNSERANEYLDDSDVLAEAYVRESLDGRIALDREVAYSLNRDLVPTIRLADLVEFARRLSVDSGAVIVATTPASASTSPPAPAVLVDQAKLAMASVARMSPRFTDSITLVTNMPPRGTIAAEKSLKDANVYDWTLSNGMRVILKPTSFVYDQVELRLTGTGGASLAPDSDYASAYLADGVISRTGVGTVSGSRLARMLDASSINLSQSVSDESIDFSAYAAPRDLDKLFQVLHLYLSAPRADSIAFRRYRERALAAAANRDADPDAVFSDTVAATISRNHRRANRAGTSFLKGVRMEKSLEFWKARTSNASSFTMVLAGDFTLDRVRPLLERYMAPLPAGTREEPRDNGVRFPTGGVRRDIRVGVGPKARTQLILNGPFDRSMEAGEALNAARDVAELALEARLRETLGGTYGVYVSAGAELTVPSSYRITIGFEGSPERMEALSAAALEVLKRLRTTGPTMDELAKTRAALIRDLDGKLEDNDYWADELAWHARMGWPLESILTHQANAKLLTMDALKAACARYLGTERLARVTMYPKRAP